MPPHFLHIFLGLWEDRGVQQAILMGKLYALHDNLSYFFNDFERLFEPKYLPSDQDILRARLRTTGINESIFKISNQIFRVMDMGGQRSRREKWIHAFDNVNIVLFLTAISGYDQTLVEDRQGNQMHEALMLFQSIVGSKYFVSATFILFLDKMDIFREKIAGGMSPISRDFPDYTGESDNVEAGREFFADKFKTLASNRGRRVYVHFTNATDTNLLEKTMHSVQSEIVQCNLDNLIL